MFDFELIQSSYVSITSKKTHSTKPIPCNKKLINTKTWKKKNLLNMAKRK